MKDSDLSVMSNFAAIYPGSTLRKIGFESVREATLKKCYTPYGREEILSFKPFSNPEKIHIELQRSADWMHLLQTGLNHPLSVLDDIRPILIDSRAGGSLLALDSFPVVLDNARLARIIKQYFERTEKPYESIREITSRLTNLKPLEDAIQKVVTDRGELKDDASQELKKIRSKLNRERGRLRSTILRIMKDLAKKGLVSDEGATIRSGRMVIPVQAEFKRKVDGFVHDVSSTGHTVYIEPVQALQINNDIRQLESEEQREIEKIIRKLTSDVRNYREELELNCGYIGELDAIHCRVNLGMDLGGVLPSVTASGNLNLIQANNPNLLLKNLTAEKPEDVVPLNLGMSEDERALVITGPNAGGKSVAMKTVGLISVMVQCGYPVPVQPDSEIPVISGLFVDIGDEQSIENDLSTFSSRLSWMKYVLEHLSSGSLVLIDEAGSGTDPEEGGALFQAFIEEVIASLSRVIVTTHHGSLKVFAHEHDNVINGAMEFNQESLSPTYRFKKGIPGSSYAFEIADRMQLPRDMMTHARSLLGEQRDKMGDLLVSLEKQMQESEEMHTEYRSRLMELEKREKIYLDKASNFENKRKKILEKAYKDAEEIMKGANRRIEEAVEKIMESGKEDKKSIKEARSDILDAKKQIHKNREQLEEKEKPYRSSEKPSVGDYVLIGDSDTTGELVELSGKNATVLVNGMKIKSKLDKLVKTNPPKQAGTPSKQRSYGSSDQIDLSVNPRLDLRGLRGEEAIRELTLYLDKAVARGLREVEIIHGKGEGILHKLVNEYLEQRREVKEFDIAPWESGGSGCTVVKL
jgi:DNA mismatch repair protein MutS2